MSSTQGFYFRCLSSVILVLTGIAACESPENDFPSGDNQSASVVSRLLDEPLWVARDAYDASHYMIVPMHAAFPGNAAVNDDLEPMPVEDIAPDSSHSFRLPLFLTSFAAAEAEGSYGRTYYEQLLQGLAVQITKRVLLLPSAEFPGVRMMNYMDGRNGVYRYGYASQGEGSGFGPYELSGSFSLGWWGFLGKALTEAYEAQRQSLPFRDEVVEVYTGPNTLRQRNIQFAEPGFYQQELIREVLGAAAFVSVNRPWGAQNKVATR